MAKLQRRKWLRPATSDSGKFSFIVVDFDTKYQEYSITVSDCARSVTWSFDTYRSARTKEENFQKDKREHLKMMDTIIAELTYARNWYEENV